MTPIVELVRCTACRCIKVKDEPCVMCELIDVDDTGCSGCESGSHLPHE